MKRDWAGKSLVFLSLFTSFSTLICCAIPILLITLGFGAALASLTASLPWLDSLGEHEGWILGIAAIVLILVYWIMHKTNYCPMQPEQAEMCRKAKRFNRIVFWIAVVLWMIGFFSSYLLYPIAIALNL